MSGCNGCNDPHCVDCTAHESLEVEKAKRLTTLGFPPHPPAVSLEWVLNLLAGMKFPEQGQAYDFVKKVWEAVKDIRESKGEKQRISAPGTDFDNKPTFGVETEQAVYVANDMDTAMRLWMMAAYPTPGKEGLEDDSSKVLKVSRLG